VTVLHKVMIAKTQLHLRKARLCPWRIQPISRLSNILGFERRATRMKDSPIYRNMYIIQKCSRRTSYIHSIGGFLHPKVCSSNNIVAIDRLTTKWLYQTWGLATGIIPPNDGSFRAPPRRLTPGKAPSSIATRQPSPWVGYVSSTSASPTNNSTGHSSLFYQIEQASPCENPETCIHTTEGFWEFAEWQRR
jgi:hypothetical protein